MSKTNMPLNKSLEGAFLLLETLATTSKKMSVVEISKLLGVTRTTVYSLLRVLVSRHYIQKDTETKMYSIGYKAYEIGTRYRYNFPFLNVADKHIVDMVSKRHVKINISVLRPPCVAVIILSRDNYLMPKMIWGYILPAYASSCGKMLLSSLPDKKLYDILATTDMKKFTPNTITDIDEFMKEVALIRDRGYAIENEEIRFQSSCVAAPIYDRSGKVIAATSFSGSALNMMEDLDTEIADVKLLAANISAELGYTPFNF